MRLSEEFDLPLSFMPTHSTKSLNAKLARVKIFLCDVDGILTDGSVFISEGGEMKQFSIQDGLGLKLLQREGIKVGWISARPSRVTLRRAEELKIDFLSQDKSSKISAAEKILARASLNWSDACYMGDDIVDLCLLTRAGLAISVPNGIAEAKSAAHHVTKAAGGHGAVREVVELILKAQKKWNRLVEEYSSGRHEKI
jgi:3-deoxy-D-manno-octulosonate 8-phosphate phosphatase (KDO 8-P phosphatase)